MRGSKFSPLATKELCLIYNKMSSLNKKATFWWLSCSIFAKNGIGMFKRLHARPFGKLYSFRRMRNSLMGGYILPIGPGKFQAQPVLYRGFDTDYHAVLTGTHVDFYIYIPDPPTVKESLHINPEAILSSR